MELGIRSYELEIRNCGMLCFAKFFIDKNMNKMYEMKNRNSSLFTFHSWLKMAVTFLAVSSFVYGGNVFEEECVRCHMERKISLRKTFMNALLVYSGKENFKAGLKYYLRHPRRDSSVMSEQFLDRYGVVKPLKIDDTKLDEALEIYWNRYTVQGKLQ